MSLHGAEKQLSLVNPEANGSWWRFDRYSLDNGWIRPAADALLERYDPWESFDIAGHRHRGGGMLERPYLSLVELADFLVTRPERKNWRATGSLPTPLGWCARHGLLGLMFLDVRQISLQPHWETTGLADRENCAKSVTYALDPTGWAETGDLFASADIRHLPPDSKPVGRLVPRSYWNPDWEEPGVLVQEARNGKFSRRRLEHLGQYFPSVPPVDRDVYRYPLPLSEDFWRLYAENADEFLDATRRFGGYVRTLGRYRTSETSPDETNRNDLEVAIAALRALAAQTAFTFRGGSFGRLTRSWVPTSLLGVYAWMALTDAFDGLLNLCNECGRIFVSSAGRARFCSARCRKSTLQREWRGRKDQPEHDSGSSRDEHSN
jgi:endogenous inhibitor of DNA gyrase (YacG/DUF329 family)